MLWSSEALDLGRNSDFGGYRGVYLGKLKQGSGLRRTASFDKGFALLPNKYGSGGSDGRGSARGGNRAGGYTSPQLVSPSQHRRVTALLPLEQGPSVSLVPHSVIPPLSAHRLPSSPSQQTKKERTDDSDDYLYEGNEAIEEEFEDIPEEDRPNSSSTTWDSGISIPSSNDNGSEYVTRPAVLALRERDRFVMSRGSSGSLYEVAPEQGQERNSYDFSDPRLGDHSSPSTHSLPAANGYTSRRGTRRVVQGPPHDATRVKSFDYESDFESDEEDAHLSNTLSRATLLKKKEETMRDIERRLAAARAAGELSGDDDNSYFSSSQQQRFSRKSLTKAYRPETETKLAMEKAAASRRETRHARELRERKFRELQMQLSRSTPPDVHGAITLHPNDRYAVPTSDPQRRNSNGKTTPRPLDLPSPRPANKSLAPSPIPPGRDSRISQRPSPSPQPSPKPSPKPSRRSSPVAPPAKEVPAVPDAVVVNAGKTRQGRLHKSRSHDKALGRAGNKPTSDRAPRRHRSLDRHSTSNLGALRHTHSTRSSGVNRSVVAPGRTNSEPEEHGGLRLETACSRSNKPMSTTFSRDIQPFSNPPAALAEIRDRLAAGDWEDQLVGVQGVTRLALFHPEVLQGCLHEINLALLRHGKNLRSQVSRISIQGFMHLFDSMKRAMEPDLDKIVNLLLNKAADTNRFLKEDSNNALDAIIENTAANKAIPILIQEGLGHRNAVVKTTLARVLAYYVERVGGAKVLTMQRDVGDRLLPAAAKLAQEGSLETRRWAKLLFQRLAVCPGFEDTMRKAVNSSDLTNIRKFLDNLYQESRTGHESAASKTTASGRYSRTM